jgi:hypothetical protein
MTVTANPDTIQQRLAAYPAPQPSTDALITLNSHPNKMRVDGNGVMQTYLGNNGWTYLPTNIARYAQALYGAWRQGDDQALNPMVANAQWLERNARLRIVPHGPRFVYFPLPMAMPPFHIPVGAQSALTAALAMDALYATGLVVQDGSMLRMAANILPGFTVTVQQGGYKVPLARSAFWYEEYAYPGVQPPRVMNGHMFAVINLNWYAEQTGNRTAKVLTQYGINALKISAPLYTDSPISAYDLVRRGQICGYHLGDIQLLRYFYQWTGITVFNRLANQWSRELC